MAEQGKENKAEQVKRPVGRPRKPVDPNPPPKRPRGRPKKEVTPTPNLRKIDKLAMEADKRGYMLIEKNGGAPQGLVQGLKKEGIEEGKVGKYVLHALSAFNQPRINIEDINEVYRVTEKYYQDCAENDVIPTQTGLANRLGITKQELTEWKVGRKRDHRYKEFAQAVTATNEEILVDMSLDNKCNNIAAIVQLKNHFGYTDEQKVVVEQKDSVVDDSLQMADVLAIAESETPQKARYKEIDK